MICVLCTFREFCCDILSSRERVSQLEQEVETLKLNLLNVQQANLKVHNDDCEIFSSSPQLVLQIYSTLFCND